MDDLARADEAVAGIGQHRLGVDRQPLDARDDGGGRDGARAVGFDDYWTKPIDLKRFLAALDALFTPGA